MTVAASSAEALWQEIDKRFNAVSTLLKLAERIEGAAAAGFIEMQGRAALQFAAAYTFTNAQEQEKALKASLSALEETYWQLGRYIIHSLKHNWVDPLGEYLLLHKDKLQGRYDGYDELADKLKEATAAVAPFFAPEAPSKDLDKLEEALTLLHKFLFLYLSQDAELDALCRLIDITEACPL